jgi:hypothetical protein
LEELVIALVRNHISHKARRNSRSVSQATPGRRTGLEAAQHGKDRSIWQRRPCSALAAHLSTAAQFPSTTDRSV